jgi:hypothetical protein
MENLFTNSILYESTKTPHHACPGESCAHVVNTGESWVCRLTGKCVASIFVSGYDRVAAGSIVKSNSLALSTEIYECKIPSTSKEEDVNRDLYGECYRVVQKLLGNSQNSKDGSKSGGMKIAMKKMRSFLKRLE